MGRGAKSCGNCGAKTGPRAHNCPECGKGFVVLEIQYPDKKISRGRPPKVKRVAVNLLSVISEYDDENEARRRKKYGIVGRSWISDCRQYLIREQTVFMDVNLANHCCKTIQVFKKRGGEWMPLKPKWRFYAIKPAIRRILVDRNGDEPKPTTYQEKVDAIVKERYG